MRIGIIGAGNIGGTLAALLGPLGHEVRLANSRGPDTLREQVADLPGVAASTIDAAVRESDLVVISIPYGRQLELPASVVDGLAGKVVVDTGNYYPERDGPIDPLDAGGATSSGLFAAAVPGARVVKAFNAIYFERLRDAGRPDAPEPERSAIPIAGDDPEAKRLVAELITEIGFAPVDAGGLAESRRQEPDTPVYGNLTGPDETRELLAKA